MFSHVWTNQVRKTRTVSNSKKSNNNSPGSKKAAQISIDSKFVAKNQP